MKQILSFILLIVWLLLSLILILTIFGVFMLVDDDSQWKQSGKQLLEIFKQS
jgi:hypothetical protein